MGWRIRTASCVNCLQVCGPPALPLLSPYPHVWTTQTGEEQINNSLSQQALWVYDAMFYKPFISQREPFLKSVLSMTMD